MICLVSLNLRDVVGKWRAMGMPGLSLEGSTAVVTELLRTTPGTARASLQNTQNSPCLGVSAQRVLAQLTWTKGMPGGYRRKSEGCTSSTRGCPAGHLFPWWHLQGDWGSRDAFHLKEQSTACIEQAAQQLVLPVQRKFPLAPAKPLALQRYQTAKLVLYIILTCKVTQGHPFWSPSLSTVHFTHLTAQTPAPLKPFQAVEQHPAQPPASIRRAFIHTRTVLTHFLSLRLKRSELWTPFHR